MRGPGGAAEGAETGGKRGRREGTAGGEAGFFLSGDFFIEKPY